MADALIAVPVGDMGSSCPTASGVAIRDHRHDHRRHAGLAHTTGVVAVPLLPECLDADVSSAKRDQGGDVQENAMGSFVLGGVMGVLALLGLFVASGAKDGVFYATGLGLFLFCVLFIFVMIHRQVGR
jgi:hypothetical protein